MSTRIQIRRDTAADWTSNNPTLTEGEMGFETDTNKLKIGDGSTAWNSLAYFSSSSFSIQSDSDWILRQIPVDPVDSDWVLNQIIHRDSEIQASAILLTNDSSVGKLSWNYDESTLDVQVNDVNIQVGQEQVFYGKAQGAIAKGDGVMFVGAQGGHVLFAKADSTSPGFRDEYIIGVAAESMANNDFGFVVSHGKVRDINTSAWAEGSILWLSPDQAGVLIDSEPTTPNHSIMFASVLKSHSSQGVLMVRPSFGYRLEQLHDVLSANPVDGDVITWNASTGYWENRATSDVDSDWVLRQISTPSSVDSEWVLSQTPTVPADSEWILRQIPAPSSIDSEWVLNNGSFNSSGLSTTPLQIDDIVTQNIDIVNGSGAAISPVVFDHNNGTEKNVAYIASADSDFDVSVVNVNMAVGESVVHTVIIKQSGTPRSILDFKINGQIMSIYRADTAAPAFTASNITNINYIIIRVANTANVNNDYIVMSNYGNYGLLP